MIEVREATKNLAAEIACLIMTAMTDDCCLYFCGEGYGLEDFRKMMTRRFAVQLSEYLGGNGCRQSGWYLRQL